MAQPKDTYTFSSTREDVDYARILSENAGSDVIVLSRNHAPTITLVRPFSDARHNLYAAGKRDLAEIRTPDMRTTLAFVYGGDVHGIALGLVATKVEAY